MDENLKHLSKPAKTLLRLLRTKYHASHRIESAMLTFPDIAQAMGIDSEDGVMALAQELRKYGYANNHSHTINPLIWKVEITREGLSAADQLTLSHQAKKLFTPLRSWIGGLVLGIAVTIAGFYVINYLQTTDSKTSDSDNANSEQAAPE